MTCVWGTNVEVMATASLFQIDVYVATESHNPVKIHTKDSSNLCTDYF